MELDRVEMLLAVRRRAEEERQRALAAARDVAEAARAEVERARALLAEARARRAQAREAQEARAQGGVTVREHLDAQRYGERLAAGETAATEGLNGALERARRADDAVDGARRALAEAAREREAVERHLARLRAERKRAAERREEAEEDDRAQSGGGGRQGTAG